MRWIWIPLAALLACRTDPRDKEQVADGVGELARSLASDGKNCFHSRPEYCLTDPAFTRKVAEQCVEKRLYGKPPKTRGEVRRAASSCGSLYWLAQLDDEHRGEVERQVEKHYQNPKIENAAGADGGTVTIDFGLLPGQLEKQRAAWKVLKSRYAESGEWQSAEASRQLARYIVAYPNARSIVLKVEVPHYSSKERLEYRFERVTDRIVVVDARSNRTKYYSKKLGGELDALENGGISLRKRDLEACETTATREAACPAN